MLLERLNRHQSRGQSEVFHTYHPNPGSPNKLDISKRPASVGHALSLQTCGIAAEQLTTLSVLKWIFRKHRTSFLYAMDSRCLSGSSCASAVDGASNKTSEKSFLGMRTSWSQVSSKMQSSTQYASSDLFLILHAWNPWWSRRQEKMDRFSPRLPSLGTHEPRSSIHDSWQASTPPCVVAPFRHEWNSHPITYKCWPYFTRFWQC